MKMNITGLYEHYFTNKSITEIRLDSATKNIIKVEIGVIYCLKNINPSL